MRVLFEPIRKVDLLFRVMNAGSDLFLFCFATASAPVVSCWSVSPSVSPSVSLVSRVCSSWISVSATITNRYQTLTLTHFTSYYYILVYNILYMYVTYSTYSTYSQNKINNVFFHHFKYDILIAHTYKYISMNSTVYT
jgi:hypothetical protein